MGFGYWVATHGRFAWSKGDGYKAPGETARHQSEPS